MDCINDARVAAALAGFDDGFIALIMPSSQESHKHRKDRKDALRTGWHREAMEQHVLIIGAGIAGPALGIALKRVGLTVSKMKPA